MFLVFRFFTQKLRLSVRRRRSRGLDGAGPSRHRVSGWVKRMSSSFQVNWGNEEGVVGGNNSFLFNYSSTMYKRALLDGIYVCCLCFVDIL